MESTSLCLRRGSLIPFPKSVLTIVFRRQYIYFRADMMDEEGEKSS